MQELDIIPVDYGYSGYSGYNSYDPYSNNYNPVNNSYYDPSWNPDYNTPVSPLSDISTYLGTTGVELPTTPRVTGDTDVSRLSTSGRDTALRTTTDTVAQVSQSKPVVTVADLFSRLSQPSALYPSQLSNLGNVNNPETSTTPNYTMIGLVIGGLFLLYYLWSKYNG